MELRLHAPDGLFIDAVDRELAGLMLEAGFKTLRFGLETMNSARQKSMGGKVDVKRFSQKIGLLFKAGFKEKEIGADIMAGLPGQRVSEVEDTIRYAQSIGIKAKLCNFSPIPFTRYGETVFKQNPQVSREPLFQNDTAMPLWNHEFTWESIRRLKNLVSRPGFME
jgi:coproporphyrinogen III oxidase-like Fe-S oxidoreductase